MKKMIETTTGFDYEVFENLPLDERIQLLRTAEETNYGNLFKLQQQRAEIYRLEFMYNKEKLEELNLMKSLCRVPEERESSPPVVVFVEDKQQYREKRERDAQERYRDSERVFGNSHGRMRRGGGGGRGRSDTYHGKR